MSRESLAEALDWRHERVQVISDEEIGLQAVVAIHSTALGPALGGLRLWRYERGLVDAVVDALRLSRGMTLKAAAAGLDLGGGKAVMLDDGKPGMRARRLERFAQELERLGGAYITAEDVGTTTEDMDFLAEHTRHVVGRSARSGIGGDPSPDTARTVLYAIRAALSVQQGSEDLDGTVVGILGLGKVGRALAASLLEQGATVVGHDPAVPALDGVELLDTQEALLERELDVLAPCALGGLIDVERAGQLRCHVVCGAANNPLTGEGAAAALAARGVLYVPDFLANCGGLVRADGERRQVCGSEVERKLDEAAYRTRAILDEAVALGELPLAVAERHAAARVEAHRRRRPRAGENEETGTVASLRMRLAPSDARYAGGLVAGSKTMELFADLETELALREGGDEGLCVAYDKVEFLAPLKVGDYVEATARVVRRGRTSRGIALEVRKVLAVDEHGINVALPAPVLAARASVTIVVGQAVAARP